MGNSFLGICNLLITARYNVNTADILISSIDRVRLMIKNGSGF